MSNDRRPYPTDLGNYIAERLPLLRMNKNTFIQDLYKRLKRTPTRGSSGLIHMVMKGDRPIPEDQEEAWARTLGILPDDKAERARFSAMCAEHRTYTATGGDGTEGANLLAEVKKLRAENATLRQMLGKRTGKKP